MDWKVEILLVAGDCCLCEGMCDEERGLKMNQIFIYYIH